MNDYRKHELLKAIDTYIEETQRIYDARIEIMRRELQAWNEFRGVLYADQPEKLHSYFNPKME